TPSPTPTPHPCSYTTRHIPHTHISQSDPPRTMSKRTDITTSEIADGKLQCDNCLAEFAPGSRSSHLSKIHPVKKESLAAAMHSDHQCPNCSHKCSGHAMLKHVQKHHDMKLSAKEVRKYKIKGGTIEEKGEEDTDNAVGGLTEEEKGKLGKGPTKKDEEDDDSAGGRSGGAGGVSQAISVA
ncbi:hypothetical protein GGR57DRAFT_298533, partial [Xylariaceae sp. FL1272]